MREMLSVLIGIGLFVGVLQHFDGPLVHGVRPGNPEKSVREIQIEGYRSSLREAFPRAEDRGPPRAVLPAGIQVQCVRPRPPPPHPRPSLHIPIFCVQTVRRRGNPRSSPISDRLLRDSNRAAARHPKGSRTPKSRARCSGHPKKSDCS